MHIVAIHAHPDDVEIQCFGTLLRLKEAGCRISIATMTPGDKGSAEMRGDEIAAVRRAEAAAAARLVGADYTCLEFRDLAVVFDNPSRRRVVEYLRRTRPDVILTAPPVDYMCDHEVTSVLVRDACFSAAVPNYMTEEWDPAPPAEKIPALYYVDAVEGKDHFGQPQPIDFVVDITNQMEVKLEALACHASQREWLRRQHGMDEYLESCRDASRLRGALVGAEYGEGFRQYKGHPYPSTNVLADLIPCSAPAP